jgi:UDP-glucose 4-epimerase
MSKNILVTGGAGFIGSHTVVALVEAGFNPIIIDDFSNSEASVLAGLRNILGRDIPCYAQDCNQFSLLRSIIKSAELFILRPLKLWENPWKSLLHIIKIIWAP